MEIKPGPLAKLLDEKEVELLYNAAKKRIDAVARGTEEHIINWFYHTNNNLLLELAGNPSLKGPIEKIIKTVPVGKFQLFLDLNFKSGNTYGHSTLPGLLDIGKDYMHFKKR